MTEECFRITNRSNGRDGTARHAGDHHVSRTPEELIVTSQPTYDSNALAMLAERTEYEAWLLEAVYSIVEQDLFPSFPDAVIYPLGQSQAQFIGYMRSNCVIGDWRLGFLNAGAPLVFVATFKLLDMLVEWVLEENGFKSTFRFQDKVKQLSLSPIFPALIEGRPWLKDRLAGLYRTLEPLRGTIIHDRHFAASDGAVRVHSSKGGIVGPEIEISPVELRILALSVVSILRYLDGTWCLDQFRERLLRHHLDNLVPLHGLPLLGQLQPFHTVVRVFSTDSDPRAIDPTSIRIDLARRYSTNDCMFDLRVLTVKGRDVVDAFLFPWRLLEKAGSDWGTNIDPAAYRVPIPDDIKPEHCERGEAG